MGNAASRAPHESSAEKYRQLSAAQRANLQTIIEEHEALRALATDAVNDFCALLDKMTALRAEMKPLREKYLRAKSELLKSAREVKTLRAAAESKLDAAAIPPDEEPLPEEPLSGE